MLKHLLALAQIFAVVLSLTCGLSSCNAEPTLVGMWKNHWNEGIEFTADGQINNIDIDGARYRVNSPNSMTWILPVEGETIEVKVEYILTRTTLSLTPKSATNMSVPPPDLMRQEQFTKVY